MCGITGIIQTNGQPIDREVLSRMTRALAHRGPDGEGVYLSPATPGRSCRVGLGHRRLRIIDLSEAGAQPMGNEDATIQITFNGEIYNFKELKAHLIRKGHRFRSESDTEVIVHGYEEWGTDVIRRLDGMFAFGLWDARNESLTLARDRFGKKPLYYRHVGRTFMFASEVKALLRHPDVGREIDPIALSRYLAFEYLPGSFSIFQAISKLPPGHILHFVRNTISIQRFWNLDFTAAEPPLANTPRDTCAELLVLLDKAVEKRLMSDVPLGVFLSGGIDSSAVVAMMARHVDAKRIATFSIGFDDPSFDESPYARLVARHFGTDHHERRFSIREMLAVLPEITALLDEPFADASILPTYLLSKFTREHVTVALGGDGGDELFAGYDPFVAHRLFALYERIPAFARKGLIEPLIRRLPVSTSNMSFDFRAKQMIRGAGYPRTIRNQVWLGAFSPADQTELFTSEVLSELGANDPYAEIPAVLGATQHRDWVDETVDFYVNFYLAEDILTKVDRASMASSLEVRAPFLDRAFAEYVNALPSRLKIKGLTRKYILKKALEGILPQEIIDRKKKGFGIPLSRWLREELSQDVRSCLCKKRVEGDGLFRFSAVDTLLQEHAAGAKDNRKKIWALYMFHRWMDHVMP